MRSFVCFLVLAVLSACDDRDPTNNCQSFCGCWEPTTLSFAGATVAADGGALSGIHVSCGKDGGVVAVSDQSGAFGFQLATQRSPGCGTLGCNSLVFTDPAGVLASKEISESALRDGGTVTLEP